MMKKFKRNFKRNKIVKHIRRWVVWRKYSKDNAVTSILALLGIIKPPSWGSILLPEEVTAIFKNLHFYDEYPRPHMRDYY